MIVAMSGRQVRRIVLEQSFRARIGHIGSALSIADLLAVLYEDVLRASGPRDPDRDRFILSKGHAALALYAVLHLRGWLSADDLATFAGEDTLLGVHPEHALPGVDFSTGSLGHGLSIGVGAALGARMLGVARRVFVLLSDAECNEGSVWEAAMFAAHHRLGALTAIVDLNGQQALDYTRDVLDLHPLGDRWRAFGWSVREIDGHDSHQIHSALTAQEALPTVVIARTVFGRGVSFMESRIPWHYLPMSEEQYHRALAELAARE
ncbi:MAG: transketolase [Chloroflexi bacterium]|nr:transketolase [Chloroflexota bacterium]